MEICYWHNVVILGLGLISWPRTVMIEVCSVNHYSCLVSTELIPE